MKFITSLILTISLTSCVGGGGTKIATNEIDSFTGENIKRTTFETTSNHYGTPKMYSFIRFSRVNQRYTLDLKTSLTYGSVFAIEKNGKLMIKLSSGGVMTLKAMKYRLSCTGCGAIGIVGSKGQGVLQTYVIEKTQLETLVIDPPVNMRVYLSDSYVEEAVPATEAAKLSKIATLILQ